MYQDALEKSGYSYKLEYKKPDEKKTKKRQRHRLILLFNPPFSNHVTTQIGKHFFEILDSSFLKKHPLHKIFNRSTVKLSFSTVRNIRSIVDAHNKQKMSQQEPKNEPSCNCQRSKVCPMDRVPGGCQAQELVYQSDVITQDEPTMTYYGQTKRPFKERWREHRHAIENEPSPHATALSSYIWKLKKKRKPFQVKWSIKCRAPAYQCGGKKCLLCLKEKFSIALHDPKTLLNAKSFKSHFFVMLCRILLNSTIQSTFFMPDD